MDKEIELINNIIVQAEMNGADSGGSYKQNETLLRGSMLAYLIHKNIQDKYTVKEVDIKDNKGKVWQIYQFVRESD